MLWERVLIPIDFSITTELLLNWAEKLSAMGLKEAVLLHVVDRNTIEKDRPQLIKEAKRGLTELEARLEAKSIQVKSRIETGIPSVHIVKIAEEEEVSMLLMGAIGKGVFKQVIAGSTAFNVARTSKIPVFIVKHYETNNEAIWETKEFEKILCPIDFSTCSTYMIERLKDHQNHIKGLVLLTVVEKGETQEEVNKMKENYLGRLVELGEDFYDSGSEIEFLIEEGIASKNIVKVANDKGVELIVMGMTGESFIPSLLLGSTAESVLRASKEPVLFIPYAK
ncbi:Nucleotide-binding universal stress protein, UspA family [Natronincola peptidivorans]|uniref:Nucleotide-binding universal stress protein, UspA family n=1 Tax=Natronincola peptidivorans TaxID=426128 RepID=A0A1I0DWL7_9FIRM|nr:universal stress protein [Natronincola peptidivorans]SET37043.1 Nucleotide-binding universal stress protein, UspA family [Natronincola peptidivorans]